MSETDTFDLRGGHVLDRLREIPDESVHCCVTSPPYWGFRSYGTTDQVWGDGWRGSLGLEPTPQLFVGHIVEVFREVRRVLRADGTCWLNLGDSYNAQPGQRKSTDTAGPKQTTNEGAQGTPSRSVAGLKPKDLVGVPWRCAFALQGDGWWLRSDIIWAKPAPKPESVTDRPTRSHEYIFLLTKSRRYFYDHEAIKEPSVCGHPSGNGYKRDSRLTYADENGARGSDKQWTPRPSAQKGAFSGKTEAMAGTGQNAFRAVTQMRNRRDVWTLGTLPTPDAHFATFPIELPETCLLAGSPPGGIVLDPFCGAGTTGLAALKHGRRFIGIELNPEYAEITRRRLERHCPLLANIPETEMPVSPALPEYDQCALPFGEVP